MEDGVAAARRADSTRLMEGMSLFFWWRFVSVKIRHDNWAITITMDMGRLQVYQTLAQWNEALLAAFCEDRPVSQRYKINVTVPERTAPACPCCGPKLQTAQRSVPLVSAKALVNLCGWRVRLGGRTESMARARMRKDVEHDTTQWDGSTA